MTYLELIRNAEYELNFNKITLGEYEEMIKLLKREIEQQPCNTPRNNLAESSQDCISREAAIDVVRKWFDKMQLNGDICLDGIISLPPVTPSYNSIKTELKPCEDVLDEIITQIEQMRDKDKIAEYPYNRCIRIIEEAKNKDV